MMYPFMTLEDNTGIAHSDAYEENGVETVKVYFEKPVYGEFLHSVAHIVIRLAREGRFDNAANF